MSTRLQDLPIAAKVAIAPLVVLIFLFGLAGMAHFAQRQSAQSIEHLSTQSLPFLQQVSQLKARTARMDAMVMRSMAWEGAGMKAKRIEELDKAILVELTAIVTDVERMGQAASAQDRPHFENMARLLAKYRQSATDTLDMKSGGLSTAAMMLVSSETEFKKVEEAVDALVAGVESREQASTGAVLVKLHQIGLLTAALVVLAALVSVGVIWACVRMITAPLAQAVHIAQKVAEGDLTVAVHSDRRDETGLVLKALAEVSLRLGGLMSQVRHAANEIESASTEIASANTDLSNRTEATAHSLQLTAQTVEALAGQTAGNSSNAEQACRIASEAADMARRGGDVVSEVVASMTQINEDAHRIRDIISMIDGIAFQTNILALNAAVEAARAGELGRGFAVVAQEVRALAGRSAASAKDIRSLISTSVEQVEAGSAKVNSASEAIVRVVDAVHEVVRLVSEVAQAGTDQARGVAEVNVAVAEMDRSTQQNAAMVEQAAAATLSMQRQAEQLMRSLSVFRLDAASGARGGDHPVRHSSAVAA